MLTRTKNGKQSFKHASYQRCIKSCIIGMWYKRMDYVGKRLQTLIRLACE